MDDRPADFSEVVSKHWPDSTAYLLASAQPCLKIRDDEIKKIGPNRNLVPLQPGQLGQIDTNQTWILGVILCPGDELEDLVAWIRSSGTDPTRIWFFPHKSTDLACLEAWQEAGYRTDQVDIVEDWDDLHPVFGLMLSDQIYEEHAPDHIPRSWIPGRKPKKRT